MLKDNNGYKSENKEDSCYILKSYINIIILESS